MDLSGRAWIAQLPAELAGQRRLLDGLMALCEADPDVRWLALGCSMGRGAADELSDLDLAMGAEADVFDAIAQRVHEGVDRLGGLVESYHHQIPGVGGRHRRIFAQYADRCQIDLVILEAGFDAKDLVAGTVVLYDPESRLSIGEAASRKRATPALVREWAFHAWCQLADCGKYLRRGSLWEAFGQLHEARTNLWRLYAAAHDVPDPQYGVTSILDFAPDTVSAAMEATVSDLDASRLLAAVRATARILREVGERLPDDQRAQRPDAMARFVTDDLAAVRAGVAGG
jgi:hypothetical protein